MPFHQPKAGNFKLNRITPVTAFLYLCYFVFFVSLVCSFRGVASVSIGLIIIAGFIAGKIDTGRIYNPRLKNILLLSCIVFFIVQAILLSLSWQHNTSGQLLQLKSGLVLVPLAICCGQYVDRDFFRRIMLAFIAILALALLYCLITACYRCSVGSAGTGVFFYHDLVSPFHQHAVQVSILGFISVVHLFQLAKEEVFIFNKGIHTTLLAYFMLLLILLSSKLVIIFLVIAVVYYLLATPAKNIKIKRYSKIAGALCLLLVLAVLATSNPVSKRFNEVLHSNLGLLKQKDFRQDIYFDGLQFRLLQVRFVKEILDENHSWLTGVSAEAQNRLNEKYFSTHMYTGDGKTDPGYTRYNTHNQFLESLLEAGVPGLVAFCGVVAAIIFLMVKRNSPDMYFTCALLLAYSLNEAVLERQFSIMIFTIFPLLFYYNRNTSD